MKQIYLLSRRKIPKTGNGTPASAEWKEKVHFQAPKSARRFRASGGVLFDKALKSVRNALAIRLGEREIKTALSSYVECSGLTKPRALPAPLQPQPP